MAYLLTDAYVRNFVGALDASCVHNTLEDLSTYLYSDATCYAGQLVAVVSDSTSTNNGAYIILANGSYDNTAEKSSTNSPFVAQKIGTGSDNMTWSSYEFQGEFPKSTSFSDVKAKKSYTWIATEDITETDFGVFSALNATTGDTIICTSGDTEFALSTVTKENVSSLFSIVKKSNDGGVSSSSNSSTDGEIAVFDGTTGNIIKASGKQLTDFTTPTKLANKRTFTTQDVVDGAIATPDVVDNSFDGSANFVAKTVDGIYVTAYSRSYSVKSVVKQKFASWVYNDSDDYPLPYTNMGTGELDDTDVMGIELCSGSMCATILAQLRRHPRLTFYSNRKDSNTSNGVKVNLNRMNDESYYGVTTTSDGTTYYFAVYQTMYQGSYVVNLVTFPLIKNGLSLEDMENAFIDRDSDYSLFIPVGTRFEDISAGYIYEYTGYSNLDNNFNRYTWIK